MKALEILNAYKHIDFGCAMDEHVKRIDEAIEELEALEHRSCEGCKYGIFESKIKYVSVMDEQLECCLVCVRNCNDYFEPKE